MTVVRGLAIFFAFASLLGYVWFLPHQDVLSTIGLAGSAAALLVLAILPRSVLAFSEARAAFYALAVFGVLSQLPMMVKDYTIVNGPDYSAVTVRVLVCALFIVMAREARIRATADV